MNYKKKSQVQQWYVKLPVTFFHNPRLCMLAGNRKTGDQPHKSDTQAISVYMQLALNCVMLGGEILYDDPYEIATMLIGKGLSAKRVAKIIDCLEYYGLAYRTKRGLVVLPFDENDIDEEQKRAREAASERQRRSKSGEETVDEQNPVQNPVRTETEPTEPLKNEEGATSKTQTEEQNNENTDESEEKRAEQHQIQWNQHSVLPESRKSITKSHRWQEVKETLKHYSDSEISTAINNYSDALKMHGDKLKITYGSLEGFLAKGVEKYLNGSAIQKATASNGIGGNPLEPRVKVEEIKAARRARGEII